MTKTFSRRALLAGGLGIFLLPLLASAQDSETEAFLKLSAELTGFPREQLDPQLARLYLSSLREVEPGTPEERQRRITEMWYTGLRGTYTGSERCAYEGALAWKSLIPTRPPGYCR